MEPASSAGSKSPLSIACELPSVDTEIATCQQSLSAVKKETPRKRTYQMINATSETFQTVKEKSDVMRDEERYGQPDRLVRLVHALDTSNEHKGNSRKTSKSPSFIGSPGPAHL
jgi:hypothetical protein